ncbi:TraB/GumN family protein [Psychroserpens sp.]|uniref:TraB/GumN family protein n=1 Tax=Psychroserpens sp. TaxID=2020870 RepID=UPI001B281A77|nr:TraB/GumN family protein [Psychroserpens sp.]MBO6606772.1 TraB/GumN family protein [Psychroserpens sp.]MBO6631829.1 TraB/GumN family protein [Psychroserpens sp.]MBO6653475.1 TraB/GumN family protein [Psychroserpens sp.]MBO6680497.1 TraB/GumN family protein [Psychroserpens sp.]MBO6750544.1 TraB/GumN family protein [Psychroserpens sp.]
MKKIFLSCITFLSILLVGNAQQLENSLLWEISGNGLESSSYLFGTIHMTCDATIDDKVQNALDNTSLLVLELDMDDPSLQAKLMKDLYMKDGKTLHDFLSKEDFALLESFVKEQTGAPLALMSNMKPFFISASFYPKMLGCPVQSFEAELVKVAQEQNEEVLGLETVEEQMNVFNAIPYEDQVVDLLRTAKDKLAYDTETFQKLLQLYDSQNIEGMQLMMQEDRNLTTSKHKDKMLDDRNKNWIPKIEEFSKAQPTFYGVGAAHLAGENGVIKLLRKAGYKVTAVK